MPTNNMNLNLPTPTVTPGPEWAEQVNEAFNTIDAHDHSAGRGVKITPRGLNINSNLNLNANSLINVKSLSLINNTIALSSPTDITSVYVLNGNLYYNNASNIPVQITNGSSVASSSDGVSRTFEVLTVSTSTVINASATTSYIAVDTSGGSISINLPNAGAVAKGRFFYIKDMTGQANVNNITITPNGLQTIDNVNSSLLIPISYGICQLVSDGVSNWQVFTRPLGTLDIADQAITNVKIADGAITTSKLAPNINSTSGSSGSFTTTSTTAVNVTNLSTTIVRTGRPVLVTLEGGSIGISTGASSGTSPAVIQLYRDATLISTTTFSTNNIDATPVLVIPASAIQTLDESTSTGSTTYKVMVYTANSGTVSVTNVKLSVVEV